MEIISMPSKHFPISMGNRHIILSKEVNRKYICKFCEKIMNDPIQTSRGELACGKCYKDHQIKPGYCPIDGEPINENDIFPDKSVSREISKLECFCVNEKNGCTWKGALSDINTHEETCGFTMITCTACNKNYVKSKQEEHEEKLCAHREVLCSYCNDVVKYAHSQIHEEFCEQRPLECPFQCGMKISKKEMFNHTHTCENILAGKICPYSIVGCKTKLLDSETLHTHMQASEMLHAAIVVEKLVFLERDNKQLIKIRNELEKNYEEIQKQLQSQEKELCQQSSKYKKVASEWKEKLVTGEKFEMTKCDFDARLTKLESNGASLFEKEAKIDTLLSIQSNLSTLLSAEKVSPIIEHTRDLNKLCTEIEKCRTEIDKLDINNAVASSNLADMELKLQLLENTSYTGRQMWKIDNFKYRMSQAEKGKITALHSAPSFTEMFGYKFCTRLYLNGDGLGKNTHLSIFFVVMKSQYDELLKWPFVKRITFRLLNHEDKLRTRKESFLSDRNSSSFQKPTKEMNIAAGCPMFIEKNKLENGGYITNDSIFIETNVEDEGIRPTTKHKKNFNTYE